MASSSLRHSTTPSANCNLYCAQCDSQIGIFENEWVRLTSYYVRSKVAGTHFATEIGTRTQDVPHGPTKAAIEGCAMSEIFCRKCSTVVGQYCKSAPDQEKQKLVGQHFYKLSKVYLKDSQTFAKVEPIFAFGGPDFGPIPPGSNRASLAPRARHSSVARSSYTPLRQSFPPGPLRATSHHPSNNRDIVISPIDLPHSGSEAEFGDTLQETSKLRSTFSDCLNQLANLDNHCSNQSLRLRNHEERLAEVEGMDNWLQTRLTSLVTVDAEHAARFVKNEHVIAAQNDQIVEQQKQLKHISDQLEVLQNSMGQLKSAVNLQTIDSNAGLFSGNGSSDFITNFETMVRAMRDAQASAQQVQALREENSVLKSKLETVASAMGVASESDIPTLREEISPNTNLQGSQTLGKRKRNVPERIPRLETEEASQLQTARLTRTTQQREQQVPTPGSSQASQTSPRDAAHAEGNQRYEDQASLANAEESFSDAPAENVGQAGSIAETETDEGMIFDVSIPEGNSTAEQLVESEKLSASTNSLDPIVNVAMPSSRNHLRSTAGQPSHASTQPIFRHFHVATSSASQPQLHSPILGEQAIASSEAISSQAPSHVPNLDQNYDGCNIDFSDDELEQMDLSSSRNDSRADQSASRVTRTDPQARRVTDTFLVNRDIRSMAPEPAKRQKVADGRRKTIGVDLERNMISTPEMFDAIELHPRQPKSVRPPLIQRSERDLNEELTRLGLGEWVGKDKNSKAYRDALDAARTRDRNLKKAAQLHDRGLAQNLPAAIVAAIQNLNATKAIPPTTFHNLYTDPHLQGVLRPQKGDKPKRGRKSNNRDNATSTAAPSAATEPVIPISNDIEPTHIDAGAEQSNDVSLSVEPVAALSAETDGPSTMQSQIVVEAEVTEQQAKKKRGRPRGSKSSGKQGSGPIMKTTSDGTIGAQLDNDDDCTVCGKRGKLLCCDGCPKVYHHKCLDPPIDPKQDVAGEWYCPACMNQREARPLQVIDPNTRAQKEQAIMERDRLAREAMDREDTFHTRMY